MGVLQDRRRRPNAVEEGQEDVVDLPPPAGPLLPLPLAPAAGVAVIVVGPAVVGLAPPAAPSPVLVVVLVGTGSLTLALAGATAASTTALAGSRRPVLITTIWQLLLVLRPTGRASLLLADRRPGRQHGLIECRVVLDDGRGLGVEGVPEPHPGGQPLGCRFPVVGDRVDARRVQPGLGDPPLGVVFDGLLGADADEGPGPLDRRDAVDDRPDALGGEGPVLRDGNVSVEEAQLLGGAGVALHRQRVHHPQRRKGALGQDLADADRRVEFRLGVLPVNPGEHLLRAEELDRRELPLLAADKYAVVGGDAGTNEGSPSAADRKATAPAGRQSWTRRPGQRLPVPGPGG